MLFIIPGFPFITSGIDMAKQDMRSGLERLAYALMIVVVATLTAWGMALLLRLQPMDFLPLGLPVWARILLRLAASFCGVFGFSLMFNSPVKLASAAAVIGALSNTLRLELVSLAGFPPAAVAADRHRPAAGADLRAHPHRQQLPPLHLKISKTEKRPPAGGLFSIQWVTGVSYRAHGRR